MDKTKIPLLVLLLALIGVGAFSWMLHTEKQQLATENTQLQEDIRGRIEQLNSLKSKYKRTNDENKRLAQRSKTMQEQLTRLEGERNSLASKYETIVKENEALLERLKSKPSVMVESYAPEAAGEQPSGDYWADVVQEKAALQAKLEQMQRGLFDLEKEMTNLEKDNKELSIKVDELKRDKGSLDRSIAFKERSLEIMSKDLVSEREARRKVEEELGQLRGDNIRIKREFVMVNKTKARLENQLGDVAQKKVALERKLSEIEYILREKSLEMITLQEQLSSVVRGAKQISRSDSAAVELPPIVVKPEAKSSVPLGRLSGEIIAVNQREKFVIIDLGDISGVRPGLKFSITRDGQKVGVIEVVETRREISAGDIKELRSGVSIKEGDKVILQ